MTLKEKDHIGKKIITENKSLQQGGKWKRQRLENGREGKGREGKGREGKGGEGKGGEGKGGEGKGGEGKGGEGSGDATTNKKIKCE